MANPVDRYRAVPSVVHRLLGFGHEGGDPYTLSRLKEDIRRDVENFLNTRIPCLHLPKDLFPELAASILTYGRPDLGTLRTNKELERFGRRIEEGIRQFEPRFQSVNVEVTSLPTSTDRTLKLQIRSKLRLEPARSFDFDSDVDMASGRCLLRIR